MTEQEKQAQLKRLKDVPLKEQKAAMKELLAYTRWKTWGQTSSGCYSELELGEPADEHYAQEAIKKLVTGDRTWKADLSLKDQLIEIAQDLIGKEPGKYERRGVRKVSIERELTSNAKEPTAGDDKGDGFDVADKDDALDVTYEMARKAVKGDEKLEAYVDAVEKCSNFDEICSDLGITKKQAYKLQSQLVELLKKRYRKWNLKINLTN